MTTQLDKDMFYDITKLIRERIEKQHTVYTTYTLMRAPFGGFFFVDRFGEPCGVYKDEWEAEKIMSLMMIVDTQKPLYIDEIRFTDVRYTMWA